MPLKYDKETIERAVRMYVERRAEVPDETIRGRAPCLDVDQDPG